jgi:hypothetical protein
MAFTIEDLGDLLALLRQHPEWRDAVRREVLTEELLGLPTVVGRLAEAQGRLAEALARLAQALDRLAARVDHLAAQVSELSRIVGTLDGRVGNLDGWRYEQQFNARARITQILRRPVEVDLADLEPVLDARDGGRLTEREWKQLLALDFLFRGRLGSGPEAPDRLLALEVSQVVDARDVQRAHDRAEILTRIGLEAIAAVGGTRVTADAAQLANRLGVRTLTTSTDKS